jgi:hypothetical protein
MPGHDFRHWLAGQPDRTWITGRDRRTEIRTDSGRNDSAKYSIISRKLISFRGQSGKNSRLSAFMRPLSEVGNNPAGHDPPRTLAKILSPEQKKTETADRPHRAKILISSATYCKSMRS